jgi:hypothetical protein
LATIASVREPIAAGASLFDDELGELEILGNTGPGRRYLLVIDAGAGTTDFAIFQFSWVLRARLIAMD